MSAPEIESIAQEALRAFPPEFHRTLIHPLANAGGFSGARIWRVMQGTVSWCLRAWPADGPSGEHLNSIHSLMCQARAAELVFVPELVRTRPDRYWIECAGRKWEMTRWMPGKADFHESPSQERLETACHALSEIHEIWRNHRVAAGPCPAVQRRLSRVAEWIELQCAGWQPGITNDLHRRAWQIVCRRISEIPNMLAPWANRVAPLQPCLCDIWHDHVLFEANTVSGIIDYGGVKIDHVAVDLARLLGSMVEDNDQLWERGLRTYAQHGHWSEEDSALARVLDETGTILGVATWLRWLYHDGRCFDNYESVARRLGRLVKRLERWESERTV